MFVPLRTTIEVKRKEPAKRVPLRVPNFDPDFSARRYNFDIKFAEAID